MSGATEVSLRRSVMSGLSWSVSQNVLARIVGIAAQLTLARLLAPDAFGAFALATAVSTVVNVAVSAGLDEVLVQRRLRIRSWLPTALAMSVALGAIGMCGMLLAAPVLATIYRAPSLNFMLPLMAVATLLASIGVPAAAILKFDLRFKRLAGIALFELSLSALGSVALAAYGAGAWSLVVMAPIATAVRVCLLWRGFIGRHLELRPRRAWRLFKRSVPVMGTRLTTTAANQADYVVLGLVAPVAIVGIYYFAYRIAIQPIQLLASNFVNVLFPALSSLGGDRPRQLSAALRAARLLGLLVVPAGCVQALLSEPVVRLIFGERWLDATPLLQVLSVAIAFDAVSWVAGALLRARGQFVLVFWMGIVMSPLLLLAIVVGATLSEDKAMGVSLGVAAYYLCITPMYSLAAFKQAGACATVVARLYWQPALLAIASFGASVALVRPEVGDALSWIVAACLGALGYFFLCCVFVRDAAREIAFDARAILKGRMPQRRDAREASNDL